MIFTKLLASVSLATAASAASLDSSLYGTWSTKSNMVFTGPGFYDPVDELLIEPSLPGRSYSFTEDGYYESALYVVTPNAKDHTCPTAVLQWEHGTYNISDGQINFQSIAVDGRQLLSDPCNDDGTSVYTRYSSNTSFSEYIVYVDSYNGRWKLQLYDADGAPIPPLWLAYRPALILPTETLNPTATASATSGSSSRRKVKRSLENQRKTNAIRVTSDHSNIWYFGIALFGLGAVSYAFV
ncbi:Rot1 protein [Saccharomycopsis crataegensis]|uniref:Protein ROT1 n=1 Tax=Saccharomycopsis crataegensis TaxID=43959 RepID=A0AAV5QRF3_9ASCO|nr:Rot1 protein [Saccharomycopsis crataegensis]